MLVPVVQHTQACARMYLNLSRLEIVALPTSKQVPLDDSFVCSRHLRYRSSWSRGSCPDRSISDCNNRRKGRTTTRLSDKHAGRKRSRCSLYVQVARIAGCVVRARATSPFLKSPEGHRTNETAVEAPENERCCSTRSFTPRDPPALVTQSKSERREIGYILSSFPFFTTLNVKAATLQDGAGARASGQHLTVKCRDATSEVRMRDAA